MSIKCQIKFKRTTILMFIYCCFYLLYTQYTYTCICSHKLTHTLHMHYTRVCSVCSFITYILYGYLLYTNEYASHRTYFIFSSANLLSIMMNSSLCSSCVCMHIYKLVQNVRAPHMQIWVDYGGSCADLFIKKLCNKIFLFVYTTYLVF